MVVTVPLFTWIVSAVTVRLASDRAGVSVTVSLFASPLMVSEALNAVSTLVMFTMSSPVPALIVSELLGLANVRLSPSVLSIVIAAPVASTIAIVSVPPLKVRIRSLIVVPVVTIGSRPV